jgi:UDP-glucose 4-epimerase
VNDLKVLVTGGAGFIGSHLVDRLVEAGHDVVVVDNLSTGRKSNLPHSLGRRSFRLLKADIRKIPSSLAKTIGRVDRVCHLAAVTSVQQSVRDPVQTTSVNVVGTLNVLEIAKALRARRVVFASSAAVYGAPITFPISEDAPVSPISPYGASKLASEHYLAAFEANHGVEAVSLRLFNVYGPRQTASQYAGVISIFARRSLREKSLQIYGNGSQTRDFIFVSDVVDATVSALEKNFKSRVFNIASGQEITILELAKNVKKITGTHSPLEFQPSRSGDIIRSVAEVSRARRELGFAAKTTMMDGLSATLQWFK